MAKLFKNDVGVRFEIDTGADLATASVKRLVVKEPDGTNSEWTDTTVDGSKIVYISKAGDLSKAGKYLIAAYVEFPGGAKHTGETIILPVYTRFDT